jgi:hypothetical protein
MNMNAFGVTDPPTDVNPILARSSSLAFWGKSDIVLHAYPIDCMDFRL